MPNGNKKPARRASFNNPYTKKQGEIYLKQQAEEQNNSQATQEEDTPVNVDNSVYGKASRKIMSTMNNASAVVSGGIDKASKTISGGIDRTRKFVNKIRKIEE